jgi:hypothetical protein
VEPEFVELHAPRASAARRAKRRGVFVIQAAMMRAGGGVFKHG